MSEPNMLTEKQRQAVLDIQRRRAYHRPDSADDSSDLDELLRILSGGRFKRRYDFIEFEEDSHD